jgi:hypothetical protein
MRRIFIVCGLVFAFLLMAQAETLAQEVYGCVNKRTGVLRIVSDLALCTAKETQLTLNQSGTQGPQGPAGPAGTACWDLNKNGACDNGEDKNNSGGCDTADCQGAPGIGSLGVYDGNDLFLGYLVDFSGGGGVHVFNADIPGWFSVVAAVSPYIGITDLTSICFSEAGCIGQSYISISNDQFSVFLDEYNAKYYLADTSVTSQSYS